MKWTLLLAFALVTATACEKSNMQDEEINLQSDGNNTVANSLVGKWRLVEIYQDRGDGSGQWVSAPDAEEVTFTASGEFSISGNSPLAGRGYNRYRIIDRNHVELFSASNANKEEYYFNREDDTNLLFNPQC
ncbi:MAG TPA: hypothetical protein VD996_03345, partial [Chitinophagaceae bacterium]|nr:hypothetical protein [Chitinophagaceae bacterium]